MISGMERIWKEVVVALFRVISHDVVVVPKKTTEILRQDSPSADRDLNPRFPKYEAGVVTTLPRCLVVMMSSWSPFTSRNLNL
jgi:hypothetical protein